MGDGGIDGDDQVQRHDRGRGLHAMPARGSQFPSTSPNLQGVRRLPVEGFPNHFLFCQIDAAAHTVIVVRMLHGTRDLESLL